MSDVIVAPVDAAVKQAKFEQDAKDFMFETQLKDCADVKVLMRILNGLMCRHEGLAPPWPDVKDRPLREFRAIKEKAEALVRSVDPDVERDAVEEVAIRMCEGTPWNRYTAFVDQPLSVQQQYREWAQYVVNGYWSVLGGR